MPKYLRIKQNLENSVDTSEVQNEHSSELVEVLDSIEDPDERIIATELIVATHMAELLDIPIHDAAARFTFIFSGITGKSYKDGAEFPEGYMELMDHQMIGRAMLPAVSRRVSNVLRTNLEVAAERSSKERIYFKLGGFMIEVNKSMEADQKKPYLYMHLNRKQPGDEEVTKEGIVALFSEVKSKYPDVTHLRGDSWLYSTNLMFRYLPKGLKEYITPKEVDSHFLRRMMPWMQFQNLDGSNQMKRLKIFADRIPKVTSEQDLLDSFPYLSSQLECPVDALYEMLGI